jgi:hypothetical protein
MLIGVLLTGEIGYFMKVALKLSGLDYCISAYSSYDSLANFNFLLFLSCVYPFVLAFFDYLETGYLETGIYSLIGIGLL